MRRVVMTEARDIRETGDESQHFEPGDVKVFSERIVEVLVRENACTVLGKVPDDYDPNRTTREPGRLAAKQAKHEDKSAPPTEDKSALRTSKKKTRSRR